MIEATTRDFVCPTCRIEPVETSSPRVMTADVQKNILYSTDCPMCKMLKAQLDANGIEYTVSSDIEVVQQMGFSSVPMLYADGQMMNAKQAFDWIKEGRE